MRELVTFVYEGEEYQASDVFREGSKIVEAENLAILHGAVIARDFTGTVSMRETSDWTPGKAAGRGGLYGLLVGVVFGGPVVGALLGALVGTVWGTSDDRKSISPEFTGWLANTLKPGDSALLVVVEGKTEEEHRHTIDRLNEIASGGEFYRTDFPVEAQTAFEKALENEQIARAAESVTKS